MSDTRPIEIEVLRYQPGSRAEPYVQSWAVQFADDTSVLEALQRIKDLHDGSLTFRWSCRMAICGSCGMMINGVPRLACRTFLREFLPGPVRVEPLAHFPIERDLVVDANDFMTKLATIRPFIVPREERPLSEGEYRQTPAELERFEQFSHCINCMLCYAACPQYGLDTKFLGPGLTALLHRYNNDSRDGAREERMQLVHSDEGVWGCTAVGYCSVVCPKQVDPANAVNQNKTMSAVDWFARFLPGRRP
ncbi:MAG TPA: succinate dehydrogenase/fumarate reductase iron-sulfur subunit [Usitatibacter sp.]|nr:succinate dehydrogenase/fumarate reductase iron-sulfur subunit [Usitatibacter sp.]